MREIKFRAWDEQHKEMHYNFEWISSGISGNDWIVFRSNRQKLSNESPPFENPYFRQQFKIMQYTGLKDKSGREIYEGDIMGRFVVKYIINNAQFKLMAKDAEFDLDYGHDHFEVIGNIYENPGLLDG